MVCNFLVMLKKFISLHPYSCYMYDSMQYSNRQYFNFVNCISVRNNVLLCHIYRGLGVLFIQNSSLTLEKAKVIFL